MMLQVSFTRVRSFTHKCSRHSEATTTTTTTTTTKSLSISMRMQCSIEPSHHLLSAAGDTETWHWRLRCVGAASQLSVLHNNQIPHACVEETFWRRFWNSFCTGIFSHPNGSGGEPWGWICRRRPCYSVGRKRASRLEGGEIKRNRSAFRCHQEILPVWKQAEV